MTMKMHENAASTVCRLKESAAGLLVERSGEDGGCSPFLFENGESPKIGSVYSDISVSRFELNHKTFDFVLDADVKMAEKYKSIMVYADICDESDPNAQFRTSEKTVSGASSLNYHYEGNLKEAFGAHDRDIAAALVYVELTDEFGKKTHAVKLEYESGVNIIHNVVHPRRQSAYLKFGNGKNPPVPSLLDEEYGGEIGRYGEKKDGIVSIAMYRAPGSTADLDYLCDFGKCDPSIGDYPILGIPIKGDFKIQEAVEILNSGRYKPSITCTISEEGSDGALVVAVCGSEYDTSVGCTVNGNKLHYDLTEYSWQRIYKEPGGLRPKKYVYTIRFKVFYRLHGGDILPIDRLYSSGGVLNRDSDEKLSYLVLAWGCLEENTRILMADGSLKKIKDVSIGECVRASNGSSRRVKNTWTGTDADCRVITDERQNAVTATHDHPFPTGGGWKTASQIAAGDVLFDENGAEIRVVEIVKTDKPLNVVNLEFDVPTIIIANGLQTGDYSAQNGCFPE